MSNAVRVTGDVLNVSTRSGVSAKTGEPWSMTTARVLVAERDVCDVTVTKPFQGLYGIPERGEPVDWLVSVFKSGNFVNIETVEPWPLDESGKQPKSA